MDSIFQKLQTVNKIYIALVVFALLIAVFYGNTLWNGFVLDDRPQIMENPYIQSLQHLPKVVTGCIWEAQLGSCKGTTLHYRPVISLSFLLTWQISSHPWVFHLVNLLYFFAVVSLLFIFIQVLTKNRVLAFLTAVLFLVHPINNESVSWISAASELTAALFLLLTALLYIQYRKKTTWKRLVLLLISYFMLALSKETFILIAPIIFVLLEFLFLKSSIRDLFTWNRLKPFVFLSVPFLVYFFMRQAVLGGFAGWAWRESFFGGLSVGDRIYLFFWLFAEYIKGLVFPYPLMFSHRIPESFKFFDLQFLAGLLLFFLISLAAYIFFRRKKSIPVFAILWMMLTLFPVLIFYFVISGNFFAERYLLVPSVGFSLFVGFALTSLWQRKKKTPVLKTVKARKMLVVISVVLLIIGSLFIVYPRNSVWSDSVTFLRTDLRLNPEAYFMQEYLAKVLIVEGDREGAKRVYEEIITRNPDWQHISRIYNSLGNHYRVNDDIATAEIYYEQAVQTAYRNGDYRGYNNLGALYLDRGERLPALLYFCQASQIQPQAQEPQVNIERVIFELQSIKEKDFLIVYEDIVYGMIFEKGEEKIRYTKTDCSEETCSFIFSTRFSTGEILLPFLIFGSDSSGTVFRISEPVFDPVSRVIILNMDSVYEQEEISFIFPTCGGVYYEANAKSSETK